MSNDRKVTKNLIQTLEDGTKGFNDAADKLTDSDRSDLASTFREFAQQRAMFSAELEKMAAAYGDDIDEDGSVVASVHRGWMSLKDAISGSDPDGVIDACVQGEDHAVEQYEEALEDDISPNLRATIAQQFTQVQSTHAQVKGFRDAVT